MYVLINDDSGIEPIRYESDDIELVGDFVVVNGSEYTFTLAKGDNNDTFDVIITDHFLYYSIWSADIKKQIEEKIKFRLLSILNNLTKYGNNFNGNHYWETANGQVVIKYSRNLLQVNEELLWPYFGNLDLVRVLGSTDDRYDFLKDLILEYLGIKKSITFLWANKLIRDNNDKTEALTKYTSPFPSININPTAEFIKFMEDVKKNIDINVEKRKSSVPDPITFYDLFSEITINMTRYVNMGKFPSRVYWFENGKCLICLNVLNMEIWYDKKTFWDQIGTKMSLKHHEIKEKLESISKKYFINSPNINAVREYNGYPLTEVESHFITSHKVY